ncbi:DUF86 domain-containing protein [Cyanosarcina cf. burmensis CCALA 770]|nr:DUF86 domain-containing protein [Cyanosarcina cf. burmensis CCALA 770]
MRDYKWYLEDILKSANKVRRYTWGMSFDDFIADELTFDAVIRNLEIIGEAVLNIPREVYERYPQIEWQKIGGLRNVLAHGYFKVREAVIWDIVQNNVPPLREQIEQICQLEKTPKFSASTESDLASSEVQQATVPLESTDASVRSIYPPQRERAAAIVPIARRLLEAGRALNATVPTQKNSLDLEELETKDYKLTLDERAKTLLISATDGRGILIKVNLAEQAEKLELAKNLTPKDVNKWLQIKQDLDKRSQ